MKKKLLLTIILLSYFSFIPAKALTNEQNALMETANAYYRKGKNIQYCTYRKNANFSPEEATKDKEQFTVCSGFTYNSYREALGIYTPKTTANMTAAAYNNKSEADILLQLNKTEIPSNFTNTEASVTNFIKSLYTTYNLQVGDLIIIQKESDGHVIMIKEEILTNGEKTDAKIIESTGNYEKDSTKITKGLSYSDTGTIKENTLSAHLKHFYNSGEYAYFTLYRPLANNNGTYNKYKCTLKETGLNAYDPTNYNCTKEQKSYSITASANTRLKYPSIDIDKTVSGVSSTIIDGSIVNLNDMLMYTIKITNNSSSTYEPITVVENISPYVDAYTESGEDIEENTVTFTVPALAPAQSHTIKYMVKVKENKDNLDKIIESTGLVDNTIKTATIRNRINNDYTDSSKLKNAYESLKNSSSNTGINFINEVYKTAKLDLNFNLDNFNIESLINTSDGSEYNTISLNENNEYAKYILNDYFGAVYTKSNGNVYLKYFKTDEDNINIPNRANRIYKEHLKNGDILIYKNSNDTKTKENGTYAYIYLDNSFYGINKLSDGTSKNEFSVTAYITNSRDNNTQNSYLNTLLGKDYYVILRPSLVNNNQYVEIPNTANNKTHYLFLGGIILIISGIVLFIESKNKKYIKTSI